jgi:hypothetical protein
VRLVAMPHGIRLCSICIRIAREALEEGATDRALVRGHVRRLKHLRGWRGRRLPAF